MIKCVKTIYLHSEEFTVAKLNDKFPVINQPETDPRTRRYLTPKRVVATYGDVEHEKNLLIELDNQITLGGGVGCTLRNGSDGENAKIVLDFGIVFNGSVRFHVWSVKGENNRVNARVRFGESVMEALSPLGEKNTTNDHANRDEIINFGFFSGNETNESGFRFVCIELLDKNAAITFKAVKGVMIYRDLDYIGSFECDDMELNRIWDVAAYTMHLNMQEYLWDGTKRDRLVWAGDMHTEVMSVLACFGDEDVVEKSLDLVRNDTPLGSWMNGISTYSIWWMLCHYEWYMHHGKKDYLEEQYAYMKNLLDMLLTYIDENGSERLPERRFIDWPTNDDDVAKHAGIQSVLKMAMEKGAFLMRELDDAEQAEKCEDGARRLAKHIPECGGTKQAASLLALSGLEDAVSMNDKFLKPGGGHGYSTFFGYYILAAKSMAGDYDGAIADIKEYWGGMLKMGATTFWEDFDLNWLENAAPIDEIVPEGKIDIHGDYGAYCYIKFRHSLCHGWASGPCPWLSRNVLGIEVLEPGCKKIRINPHLGHLHFAKGSYPTPYGAIEVTHYLRSDGTIKSDIVMPEEIELEV